MNSLLSRNEVIMAMKKYENERQFTLRINADVFEKIQQYAIEDSRSAAKEIEFILKEYIDKRK